MPTSISRYVILFATSLLLQGCVIKVNADSYDRDISKVFGGIDIDEGAVVGDLDSVNGSISIDDGSTAGKVETVNGGIKVRDDVSVRSLETVNGGIRAGYNLKVDNDVSTVNGGISLKRGTVVTDDISTVNGKIDIRETEVGGNVETVNGDVLILDGSVVFGDIIFEKNGGSSFWSGDRPTLTIDGSSAVKGAIRLYREVKLDIDDDAEIGPILEEF